MSVTRDQALYFILHESITGRGTSDVSLCVQFVITLEPSLKHLYIQARDVKFPSKF